MGVEKSTFMCLRKLVRVFAVCVIAACGVGESRGTVPLSSSPDMLEDTRPVLTLVDFESRVFNNTRKLRVLLPAGYSASRNAQRKYPVLYLNDGQNLFDSTTSVFNSMEWRVDETSQSLMATGRIPAIIIVGIDNAGRHARFKEYFPYVDEHLQPPEPDPQGRRYPEFLVDEVIPFIETSYRASANPTDRGIGGSSAGALAAIYAVISRPGVFGRLLVESPSIYVDDARILKEASPVTQWPERIFLGAGTNESSQPNCDPRSTAASELVADIRRFESILHMASVASQRIRVTVTPCGEHNEAAWAARFPDALLFLYGR